MSPVTFRPALRDRVHVLVGLAGASGSGKSYSALRLARGLAGDRPFAVLDSEARRMLHYADRFLPWDHGELVPPFRPQTFIDAIRAADAAGYPVIVVDSMSMEYSGPGGLSSWQEEILDKRAGDDLGKRERLSAAAWKEPKSAHAKFVSELLQVQAHIILAFRARQAIEFAKENGKTVVRQTTALDSFDGWLIESEHTRMPIAFELTCSFLMTPDRPGVPRPIKLPEPLRPMIPLDQPITEQTGVALAQWAGSSEAKAAPKRGKDAPDVDLDAEAQALTEKVIALVTPASRERVYSDIAANRHAHAADPAAHLAWLGAQLERASEAAAKRGDQDLDL